MHLARIRARTSAIARIRTLLRAFVQSDVLSCVAVMRLLFAAAAGTRRLCVRALLQTKRARSNEMLERVSRTAMDSVRVLTRGS